MRIVPFVLCCTIVSQACAQQIDPKAALDECSAFSQAQMHKCLVTKEAESEKLLLTAQRRSAGAIARWDEDAKFVERAQQELRLTGEAFLKYRKARCALARSLGGGAIDNALELRRLACMYELNTSQANYLEVAASQLPAK